MPSQLLNERTALIVGAGHGTGAAIALTLAAAGAKVCTADLNPDRAEAVAAQIVSAGGEAFGAQVNVANRFELSSLIEDVRDRFGSLNIVVQAARNAPQADALTMDEWDLRRTVDVNVVGAFMLAQLAARVMADEGGGDIFLLSRTPGADGMAAYTATQAALPPLAEALAVEWAASGVRVHNLPAASAEGAVRGLMLALTA